MSKEKGRLFSIDLEHQSFGKNFTMSGNLWYFNSKDYVFDSQSERILKKSNTVTTINKLAKQVIYCLLYTSPSPRDKRQSRMPSSA